MRVRVVAGTILLVLAVAGCSSGSNKAAPAASGGLAVTGLEPTGPIGVVATGSATQEVRADLAFVLVTEASANGFTSGGSAPFTIGPNGQPTFPTVPAAATTDDHNAIRNALRPLGIASTAIDFSVSDPSDVLPNGGGGTVQVEVSVAKLPAIATAVVAAIKKAGTPVGSDGMRFGLVDCSAGLSTARTKALANAHTRAQALATATDVTLGSLTSVTEQSAQSGELAYLGGSDPSVCGRSAFQNLSLLNDALGAPLAALGAKPQVELTDSISVAYALGSSATRTISAVGAGEATGPADAGDIFVLPQDIPDPVSNTPGAAIDEARVLGALEPLGVAKSQVDVDNATSVTQLTTPASSYVRVHVTLAQLKAIGAKIVAALQPIVGSGAASGVIFSASNCTALTARALANAARDAGVRLGKLASAANVRLGAIVGVADAADATTILGVPAVDSCKPDFSSSDFSATAELVAGGTDPGSPSLSSVDATPQVTESVSLSVSRAMTS